MKVAVFPGSFDPVTKGHLDLINRARNVFDKLIVAVGNNVNKKYMFSQDERIKLVRDNLRRLSYSNVKVVSDEGLTVNLLKSLNSKIIVRGIRNSQDLDYERAVADINHHLDPQLETVFLLAKPEYQSVSSSILKETFHFGGDISGFIPENVLKAMEQVKNHYEK